MDERRESAERATAELTSQQRATLLKVARGSIEAHLKAGSSSFPDVEDPELRRPGAAFVTLTRKGKLRGCIGYSEAIHPLCESVAKCAIAAATQDYRFTPVTLQELPELAISISALTPLQKIENVEAVVPGRHGLMVVGRNRRGLLLPQVASERAWDRETFLEETCRKASLPADAWKEPDVEIFIFEAEVFSDREPGQPL